MPDVQTESLMALTLDRHNPSSWPAVLTPEQLAFITDLSVDHITRLCRRGQLEHTRWGRWIRIPRLLSLKAAGYEETEIQALTVTH